MANMTGDELWRAMLLDRRAKIRFGQHLSILEQDIKAFPTLLEDDSLLEVTLEFKTLFVLRALFLTQCLKSGTVARLARMTRPLSPEYENDLWLRAVQLVEYGDDISRCSPEYMFSMEIVALISGCINVSHALRARPYAVLIEGTLEVD